MGNSLALGVLHSDLKLVQVVAVLAVVVLDDAQLVASDLPLVVLVLVSVFDPRVACDVDGL